MKKNFSQETIDRLKAIENDIANKSREAIKQARRWN